MAGGTNSVFHDALEELNKKVLDMENDTEIESLATILRDILESECAGGCCNHGPKENYDIESSYDLREVVKQFLSKGKLVSLNTKGVKICLKPVI